MSFKKMCFEDLEAWQRSRELVNAVYELSREASLARDFGLRDQIQRAAVSVMSNIAEGFERQHFAEKIQAYNIARASCGEVRSLLYVIGDNYADKASAAAAVRLLAQEVGRLTSGLLASTKRRVGAKASAVVGLFFGSIWFCVKSLA